MKDKQYFTCPPNHGLFMRAKAALPELTCVGGGGTFSQILAKV